MALGGATATHGSLRPSELTTCGSLRHEVRDGHQNKPHGSHFIGRSSYVLFSFRQKLCRNKLSGGPFRTAQTCTHVMRFAGNFSGGFKVLSEWTLGGHCNAWFAAAIRTNHLRVTATRSSRRPSERTAWEPFYEPILICTFFFSSEAMSEQTSGASLQRMGRCGHQN